MHDERLGGNADEFLLGVCVLGEYMHSRRRLQAYCKRYVVSIAHFIRHKVDNFAVLVNGERCVDVEDAWLYRTAIIADLQRVDNA